MLLISTMATLVIGFAGGILFSQALDSPHNNSDFEIFWQSWDILERDYYTDLPEDQELVYGAIQGLLASTGDPYTRFVPPADAEEDRQFMAGEYEGIGTTVSPTETGDVMIEGLLPNSPAESAGLMPGDLIRAVDGIRLASYDFEDAVDLMRGEPNTTITLTIFRPAEEREFLVDVTRATIEWPNVQARMYGDVGYIALFTFNERATVALEREIADLLDQGATALILDLRGNPGGLLEQAVSVSDLFLGEGVVVKQQSSDDDERVFSSNGGDLAEDIPLVVLIDERSASASEVVAGALRDQDRAVLIGQTSFGKGSVQYVYDMPDDSQLYITASLWYTPDGTAIQGDGLIPDVEVLTAEITILDSNSDTGTDPEIAAAIEYLAAQQTEMESDEEPGT
ncbi:MAG: S41 family peptidase [Chloroflexi bacterium]|nr:S41 family peptidase [Chloroflexota bacterium]